jgi:hypothetical protein
MIFVAMLNTFMIGPNYHCRQFVSSSDKMERNEDEKKYCGDTVKNKRELTAGLNA